MTTYIEQFGDKTIETHTHSLPFKIYGNPPKTLIALCLRYADQISEVGNEGEDGYWIYAKPGFWNSPMECMCIHEYTVKDCRWQLPFAVDTRPETQR